jgi:hypothetical protein
MRKWGLTIKLTGLAGYGSYAPRYRLAHAGPVQRLTCYRTRFARARPGGRDNRMQALVRHIDDPVGMAARKKGRLASPALTETLRKSVERTVRLLEEAAKLRAAAESAAAYCGLSPKEFRSGTSVRRRPG